MLKFSDRFLEDFRAEIFRFLSIYRRMRQDLFKLFPRASAPSQSNSDLNAFQRSGVITIKFFWVVFFLPVYVFILAFLKLREMIIRPQDYLTRPKIGLVRAPGSMVLAILRFIFSKRTFENVFAQAMADMRDEHAEALAAGKLWKARWIVCRDHLNILLTVTAYVAATAGKRLVGIWKMIP